MAQATLNPAINELDTTSLLYDLYTRFYDGMTKANSTDAPEFVSSPIYKKNDDGTDLLDDDGAKVVDTNAMATQMAEYSTILMKNSAYMMANAIISTIDPDGGTGSGTAGSGFLSRSGDTMQGELGALYGFQAGFNNTKIFETTINSEDKSLAIVTGNLQVTEDATIEGNLNLSDNGLYFGSSHALWYERDIDNGDKLCFASSNIEFTGKATISDSLQVGDLLLSNEGLSLNGANFYHSGNSNMSTVDWTMCNGTVAGNLKVNGETELAGKLESNGGFAFSVSENKLLYSESAEESESPYITLNSDLSIINDHGIKFNNNYIVWVRDTDKIVSFSAPGCVMNLGDGGEDAEGNKITTKYIALQSDIYGYNGDFKMVGHDGSGNFPNGFSVGAANALGTTFYTYTSGEKDYGVVSKNNLRFGEASGPSLSSDGSKLTTTIPFIYMSGENAIHTTAAFDVQVKTSESSIYNPTNKQEKAAVSLTTLATQFLFNVPIEASGFAVKSSKYKTRLEEDALFFDDGIFIEGITGGMRMSKNSMFDGNLYSFDAAQSSISFSSGFAGRGWAIMEDTTTGGIHATFDNLTIRKKMRVYEFEAQRISVTNGSFWVSDSCSGDEVRELS